jgi:hypothetical protein
VFCYFFAVFQLPSKHSSIYRSTFTVDVDRGDGELGLQLKFVKKKLVVQQLSAAGAMERYNDANPDKKIRKDDLIVGVNDVEIDPQEMVKEIKGKSKLRLVVERPFLDVVYSPNGTS